MAKGLEFVSSSRTVVNKLIEHMKNCDDEKECEAAEIYFRLVKSSLAGSNAIKKFIECETYKETQFVQNWVIPVRSLQAIGSNYKEGEFPSVEDEISRILTFIKKIASEDSDWHKEVEDYLNSLIEQFKNKPVENEVSRLKNEIDKLVDQLDALYLENAENDNV